MEGLIANYYEYHFLYISGIHHVESKNVQGMSLMKFVFHPGTDMADGVGRDRSSTSIGRGPSCRRAPCRRSSCGSIRAACLSVIWCMSSPTRSPRRHSRVGPVPHPADVSVALPGVSAPPPFGGSQRTVCVRLDPNKLRARSIAPEEVAEALAKNNTITPSGNIRVGDSYPIVRVNSIIAQPTDMGTCAGPQHGSTAPFTIRDLGTVEDAHRPANRLRLVQRQGIGLHRRHQAGRGLDGRASSKMCGRVWPPMQDEMRPNDIDVSFQLDQSVYVQRSIKRLGYEGGRRCDSHRLDGAGVPARLAERSSSC